jgi:hypothetical protein
MATQKLHDSIKKQDGFILPLTMIFLLFLSLFCFQGLQRLNLNQADLVEQQTTTQTFLIFQSTTNDLRPIIESTSALQGSGTLIESGIPVNYRFKFISMTQLQVNLTVQSVSGSTLSASYVYNKETKQIEQWVNQ